MDFKLKCQICGDRLKFNPDCPCTLYSHLIEKHPQVEMVHFSNADIVNNINNNNNCCANKPPKHCLRAEPPIFPPPKCLFKTTVETWKPGPLRVTCPHCSHVDRPSVRQQRNRVAYSSLGAICLLALWPICFLPILMSDGSQIQLFCRKCGQFLGQYEQKSGRMTCPARRQSIC